MFLRGVSDWIYDYFRISIGPYYVTINYALAATLIVNVLFIALLSGKNIFTTWKKRAKGCFWFLWVGIGLSLFGTFTALLYLGDISIAISLRMIFQWFSVYCVGIVLFLYGRKKRTLDILLKCIIFITLVVSAVELLSGNIGGRLSATSSHPNSAGVFFGLAGAILIFDKELIRNTIIRWTTAFFMFTGLILTYSRSALVLTIMLVLSGLYFFSSSIKMRKTFIGITVLAIIIALFFGSTIRNRWSDMNLDPNRIQKFLTLQPRTIQSTSSLEWRFINWAGLTKETLKINPFIGVGNGAEFIINPLKTTSKTLTSEELQGFNPHSWIVKIFANYGFVGLFIWFLLFVAILRLRNKTEKWLLINMWLLGLFAGVFKPQIWVFLIIYVQSRNLRKLSCD